MGPIRHLLAAGQGASRCLLNYSSSKTVLEHFARAALGSFHSSLSLSSNLSSFCTLNCSSNTPHSSDGLISSGASPLSTRPASSQLQSFRLLSSDSSRSAALRRLSAANQRRETRKPSSSRVSNAAEQEQEQSAVATQAPQETAQTTAVVPVHSKASEVQLASVLKHPALIITRPIEWGTVIFGYEQANRYTVYDQNGQIVAHIAEDYTGFKNEIGRQLLRSHRSFSSTVFSADGQQVIFKVRRPAYLINSTMFVEDGEGNILGEIHQRWHLLKRNYDLYMGKTQFAQISGNFLAWEFELKDRDGCTLALLDRNFSGFAKEIFTDAGKYVIHFGNNTQDAADTATQPLQAKADATALQASPQQQQPAAGTAQQPATGTAQQPAAAVTTTQQPATGTAQQPAAAVTTTQQPLLATDKAQAEQAPAAGTPVPPVTPMAMARTDVSVIPTMAGNQLVVARPLELSERMLVLACAITVDYDYFSQHSRHGGGLLSPPIIMPVPTPMPGTGSGSGEQQGPPGSAAGGAAAGAAGEVGSASAVGAAGPGAGAAGGPAAAPDMPPAGGSKYGDEGFSHGVEQQSSGGWQGGQNDQEITWDMPKSDGGGGDGETSVVGSVLGTLWGVLTGGD